MEHEILNISRDEVIKLLQSNDYILKYIKLSDDKMKETTGTLSEEIISFYGGEMPKTKGEQKDTHITYWDTQSHGWRSFYFQNLRFIQEK